jgi:hypothetical protein
MTTTCYNIYGRRWPNQVYYLKGVKMEKEKQWEWRIEPQGKMAELIRKASNELAWCNIYIIGSDPDRGYGVDSWLYVGLCQVNSKGVVLLLDPGFCAVELPMHDSTIIAVDYIEPNEVNSGLPLGQGGLYKQVRYN